MNSKKTLHLSATGNGPPLVLVHGYLGGPSMWRAQVDHFRQSWQVITPSLAGFSESTDIPAPGTIAGHAELILDALIAAGIEQFHLLGHSMGGMIVQEMARLSPEQVRTLSLFGTGPNGVLPGRFESIEQSRQRIISQGLTSTAKQIAATWFIRGEADPSFAVCMDEAQKATQAAALSALSAWELWSGRENLANLTMPTMVLWGDRDRSYPWPQPEALWRGIANCSLSVIPGCAHNAHMEKPYLFNALLQDFITHHR